MAHSKSSSGLLGDGLWMVPLPMSLVTIVGSRATLMSRPGLHPTIFWRQLATNAFWQVLWSTPASLIFTSSLDPRVLSSHARYSTAGTTTVETDSSTRRTYSPRPAELFSSGPLHIYTSLRLSTTARVWPRFLPAASITLRVSCDHTLWCVRPALHTLPALKAGLVARWASAKFRALTRVGSLPRIGSLLHTGSLWSLLHVGPMLRVGRVWHGGPLLHGGPVLYAAALTHAASILSVLSVHIGTAMRTIVKMSLTAWRCSKSVEHTSPLASIGAAGVLRRLLPSPKPFTLIGRRVHSSGPTSMSRLRSGGSVRPAARIHP